MRDAVVPLRGARTGQSPPSDEALIAACAIGEAAALASLFDRLHASLFRFVSHLIGSDGADVDDLVQATFLEVWRSAAQFKGRSSALTWILGIAANLGRRHVRTEGRRARAFAGLSLRASCAPEDVSAEAERRELVARMAGAMVELPHDLRTAFLLCEVEGLSGVDAARALGVRPGTLWRRLHEARQHLRASVAEGKS
jgi:RNA polymerase sigma factor (sigma-70 family)